MEPVNKTRLMSYVYLQMERRNQLERIVKLENDAILPAMKESDGSQQSLLKSSRIESAVVRKIEQEKKIHARISEIDQELDFIENAIDSLIDPMQKEVLKLRYIDCENCRHTKWNDVARMIYGSDEEKHIIAIWRIHGHALQELSKQQEE